MTATRKDSSETTSSQETVRQAPTSRACPETHTEETADKSLSSSEQIYSTSPATSPVASPRITKRTHPTIEPDPKREAKMPSSSSQSHHSSSKKHHSSSSSSSSPKSRSSKSDNWTDVTEPEERRRIQNRLAQRKFREKAKEQKEKADRDTRNQQYAGSSYHVPDPAELLEEDDCSGLPWGSISMRHVMARGHESESRRGGGGSGSGSHPNHNSNDEDYMMMALQPGDDGYGNYYGSYSGSGGGSSSTTTTYDAYPTITSTRSYSYGGGSHDSNSAGDFTPYDDGGAYYYTDYDNTRSA